MRAHVSNPDAPERWPRVLVPDPVTRHAIRSALDRAWTLLGEPACGSVVAPFSDVTGQPLSRRLEGLGMDARTYLGFVVFVDGTRLSPCTAGILAFTVPGSRVVRVCSTEVQRTSHQRQLLAAAVIHEMLHTLGLGENPPASREITRRVLERCRG